MKLFQSVLKKNDIRSDQGFTLLEILIGLFVFTVGIMAVMTMTISAMGGFTRAQTSTSEINRTGLNLEALKQAGYKNGDIFTDTGSETNPVGSDGGVVGYDDTENAVVFETRLIRMRNNNIRGCGVGDTYEVYYTKPLVE